MKDYKQAIFEITKQVTKQFYIELRHDGGWSTTDLTNNHDLWAKAAKLILDSLPMDLRDEVINNANKEEKEKIHTPTQQKQVNTPTDIVKDIFEDNWGEYSDDELEEPVNKINTYTNRVVESKLKQVFEELKDKLDKKKKIAVIPSYEQAENEVFKYFSVLFKYFSNNPILQKCILGEYCNLHQCVHGKEAEQLRSGCEKIAENIDEEEDASDDIRVKMLNMLDEIDASDSSAYLGDQYGK